MKKISTLIALVIGIAVLGTLVFFLFFRTTSPASEEPLPGGLLPESAEELFPEASENEQEGNPGGVTEGGEAVFSSRLSAISSFGIVGYAPLKNGNVRMVRTNGQISLASPGEEAVTESSNTLDRPSHAVFTSDGQKVAVLFGNPSAHQASLFDASAKRWSALPGKILSLAASPNDLRIAYTTEVNGKTSISVLNFKDRAPSPSLLYTLSALDLTLSWPSSTLMSLQDRPSALTEGNIFSLTLPALNLVPTKLATRGTEALWNPSGANALMFTAGANMRGGSLSLITRSGAEDRSFSFLTLPSKCTFGKIPAWEAFGAAQNTTSTRALPPVEVLYCAIPSAQSTFRMAQLPDEYLQKSLFTEDKFYRISLLDGRVKKLFDSETPLDATMLRVASGTLYFINRYDQKLYSLSLPN